MATFPSLVPATRSYSLGEFPVSIETGFGGGNVRFLHNTNSSGVVLDLTFTALTQENAKLIRDHYRGQDGTHVAFDLPVSLWQGQSSASNIVSSAVLWRYAQSPTEDHLEIGRITMTIQLISLLPL